MTKYYVGYKQGNDDYVYVNQIDQINVKVVTSTDNAIGFTDKKLAKDLQEIATSIVANQDFVVLEITTDIKEVK